MRVTHINKPDGYGSAMTNNTVAKNTKSRSLLIITLIVLLVLGWLGWKHFHSASTEAGTAPMAQKQSAAASSSRRGPPGMFSRGPNAVYVGTAATQNVDVYLKALGTVIANRTVTVTSRVTGELQQVFFEEGQYVEKGQRLAQIDDRSYQATLAQYQGSLAQNQALLQSAEVTLKRYQGLFAQDSLSQQDLQDQIATVGQYRGAVKADEAQVASAKLNIDYANIHAPVSGYVGLRLVDPGNLVSADSTEIVTVTQTDPIAATFSIPQAQLQPVLTGLRAGEAFPVYAYDQNGSAQIAQGTLKYISNQIDTNTGTVKLKATFDNKAEKLYPNQFVNIELKLKTLANAIVIPKAALQLSDNGDFVFVVGQDAKVEKRQVTAGPNADDDNIVILKGVKVGEQVVITGMDNLSNGAQVKVLTQQQDRS